MRYAPMLCHMGGRDILAKKGFLFEPKLDGVRMLLYKEDDRITLLNRNGVPKLEQYPELAALGGAIRAKSCVLDGEVIVYDSAGHPSFQLLQKREHVGSRLFADMRAGRFPASYVAFDVLEAHGQPLLAKPLKERKAILAGIIREAESLEVAFYTSNGPALWKEMVKRKMEGIIAKKEDSAYAPGQRTWDWLKVKNLNTVDVVIVGYHSIKRHVSSLCMALYKNDRLTYIGRVGTGFTGQSLDHLGRVMAPLRRATPAVVNPPPGKLHWVEPRLVAEVEYLQVTNDNQLRAPVFRRLRQDKLARQCTWEDQI